METLQEYTQEKISNPKTKLDYEMLMDRARGYIDRKLVNDFGKTIKPQVGKQYTLRATDTWCDSSDEETVVEIVEKIKGNKHVFKVISGEEVLIGNARYFEGFEQHTANLMRTFQSTFEANINWYVDEYDKENHEWRTTVGVSEQCLESSRYSNRVGNKWIKRNYRLQEV